MAPASSSLKKGLSSLCALYSPSTSNTSHQTGSVYQQTSVGSYRTSLSAQVSASTPSQLTTCQTSALTSTFGSTTGAKARRRSGKHLPELCATSSVTSADSRKATSRWKTSSHTSRRSKNSTRQLTKKSDREDIVATDQLNIRINFISLP